MPEVQQVKVEAVNKIKSAGVVGAGGAGFPTDVKIAATAEYLVVNGAECEPLLQVDQQLMQLKAAELIKGVEALMAATGVVKAFIALKKKYEAAREELDRANKNPRIELFLLEDFYPAGDEHVLVYEVLGRAVPQGGIPLKVGCIVNNVETVLNVSQALEEQHVLDKYVCITGAVNKPMTLKLPLGTSIREAVFLAGSPVTEDIGIIEGGPVMGKVVIDKDAGVTKTTKGLIVLPADHSLIQQKSLPLKKMLQRARSVCMQCMRCTEVCPRALLGHQIKPHKIMRSISYMIKDVSVLSAAQACSECGVCELVCEMNLSPRRVNAALKAELGKAGIKPKVIEGGPVSPLRDLRKVYSKRVVARLGLSQFQRSAPMQELQFSPKVVKIPLKQHLGAPARPVVNVGQKVQRGEVVGEIPEGALGARVHASISGIVTEITDCITILAG